MSFEILNNVSMTIMKTTDISETLVRRQEFFPEQFTQVCDTGSMTISVGLDGYNKRPRSRWVIKNRHLLTVNRAGKSKVKVLVGSMSGEGQLPGSQTEASLLCWKGSGASPGVIYKGRKAIHASSTPRLHHLPKAPLPNGIPRRVKISTCEFGRGGESHLQQLYS